MTGTVWLTPARAAEYLDLRPKTLTGWRRENRGPRYHRLSGRRHVRYAADDIDRWVRGERM